MSVLPIYRPHSVDLVCVLVEGWNSAMCLSTYFIGSPMRQSLVSLQGHRTCTARSRIERLNLAQCRSQNLPAAVGVCLPGQKEDWKLKSMNQCFVSHVSCPSFNLEVVVVTKFIHVMSTPQSSPYQLWVCRWDARCQAVFTPAPRACSSPVKSIEAGPVAGRVPARCHCAGLSAA